jgi:hypothetical protein
MATRIATHWAAEFAAAMKINARVQLFFFNFKLYRLSIALIYHGFQDQELS